MRRTRINRFHSISVRSRTMFRGSVFKFLFTSAMVLAAVRKAECQKVEPKIVNGFNATSMDGFKHQVSIREASLERVRFGAGHRCGGSLISYSTVLTAAHCLHDGKRYLAASLFVIVMGGLLRDTADSNTLSIPVSRIAGHKNFKDDTFEHDIALMYLSREVPFNHPTAQPINLTTRSPIAGQSCQISGWGTTAFQNGIQPNLLMAANLTINSKSACNMPNSHNGNVLRGMFCAGPFTGPNIVDSCQGDSGGPLTCSGILVGITSNGVGCAYPNYPGIYIDVFYYQKWILAGDSTSVVANFVIIFSSFLLSLYMS